MKLQNILLPVSYTHLQTDYDDDVEEVCCPECGQIFDVDWDDDENDDLNEEDNKDN